MNDNTTISPAGDRWCILRTAGPRTLPLVRSLADAGFDVWTPRDWRRPVQKKGARPTTRRAASAMADAPIAVPIMPTFVFARADRLADLAKIARDPVSAHPAFSIFRHQGRFPLIADRDLSQLRRTEERASVAVRRQKRRKLVMGQRVSFSEGAFAGIEGVVEDQKGQFALVAFRGGFRMKIAAWRDEFDDVEGAAAQMGAAA